MKRFTTFALVCVFALLMLSLAACRNNDETPQATTPPPAGTTPPPATPSGTTPPVATAPEGAPALTVGGIALYEGVTQHFAVPEMTDFTLFSAFGGDGGPRGEYPFWQEIARLTNMQMTNIANPNIADPAEALNQMLLSGELADVIYVHRNEVPALSLQGAFIPLNDLIAEHAPNIQRYFDLMPDVRVASTNPNGNIYAIIGTLNPIWGDGIGTYNIPTQMWFIRQDWLDNLGLEIPTTFDEYVEVMRAFRHNDPTGEGISTIPYFTRGSNIIGMYALFGVPGEWADWGPCPYNPDEIVFGRTHERYRTALRYLAEWYQEGLFDPEIFTRGGNARQELFASNQGGMTFDWFESTSAMNVHPDVLAAVPDFNLVPMLPVYNYHGVRENLYAQANPGHFAWGISPQAADPVALIRWMDFFFSESGGFIFTHGVYGQSFTLENGVAAPTAEALEFTGGIPNYLRSIGLFAIGGRSPLDLTALRARPYGEVAYTARRLYTDADIVRDPFIGQPPRTAEEEAIWATHMADIHTHTREFEQQVIFGQIDVDEGWAAYLATLDALGLQEIYAIQRAAHARAMGR